MVSVKCWFCHRKADVPRGNINCWDCPTCEQYNGFTQDGDYNKQIPAQFREELNFSAQEKCQRLRLQQQQGERGEGFDIHAHLCSTCNDKQQVKVNLLRDFRSINENTYDAELRQYERHLDKRYDICQRCKHVLRAKNKFDLYRFRDFFVQAKHYISSDGSLRDENSCGKTASSSTADGDSPHGVAHVPLTRRAALSTQLMCSVLAVTASLYRVQSDSGTWIITLPDTPHSLAGWCGLRIVDSLPAHCAAGLIAAIICAALRAQAACVHWVDAVSVTLWLLLVTITSDLLLPALLAAGVTRLSGGHSGGHSADLLVTTLIVSCLSVVVSVLSLLVTAPHNSSTSADMLNSSICSSLSGSPSPTTVGAPSVRSFMSQPNMQLLATPTTRCTHQSQPSPMDVDQSDITTRYIGSQSEMGYHNNKPHATTSWFQRNAQQPATLFSADSSQSASMFYSNASQSASMYYPATNQSASMYFPATNQSASMYFPATNQSASVYYPSSNQSALLFAGGCGGVIQSPGSVGGAGGVCEEVLPGRVGRMRLGTPARNIPGVASGNNRYQPVTVFGAPPWGIDSSRQGVDTRSTVSEPLTPPTRHRLIRPATFIPVTSKHMEVMIGAAGGSVVRSPPPSQLCRRSRLSVSPPPADGAAVSGGGSESGAPPPPSSSDSGNVSTATPHPPPPRSTTSSAHPGGPHQDIVVRARRPSRRPSHGSSSVGQRLLTAAGYIVTAAVAFIVSAVSWSA